MKTRLILLFILISFCATGQRYILSYPICVVFDKNHKPIKAYQEPIDCYKWMNTHNEQSFQENVNMYYPEDTVSWKPSNAVRQDDVYDPTGLTDNFLRRDTIYLIMQNSKELSHIADRAYKFKIDGQKYVDNFKLAFIPIPYYCRDKRSYDEIYRQKRAKLQKRK